MRPPFRSGGVASTLRPEYIWWRLRRRFRSPALYWAVAAAIGLVTTAGVARLVGDAEAGAARYGDPTEVWRAAADLPAGHLLEDDDVMRAEVPRSAVPDDAPSLDAIGRRLTHRIVRGEVLGTHDVVDGSVSALAATLGDDLRAVSVPASATSLDVDAEDVVDVWGLDPATYTYTRAAHRGRVLRADERAVVVAVEPRELPRVLAAVGDGSATLTLRGDVGG